MNSTKWGMAGKDGDQRLGDVKKYPKKSHKRRVFKKGLKIRM